MHTGFQMPIPPPPLMNPPPQIFGGYNDHALGMPQLPPDLLAAQMFADHGLLEDTNEAKRRRIARVSSVMMIMMVEGGNRASALTRGHGLGM